MGQTLPAYYNYTYCCDAQNRENEIITEIKSSTNSPYYQSSNQLQRYPQLPQSNTPPTNIEPAVIYEEYEQDLNDSDEELEPPNNYNTNYKDQHLKPLSQIIDHTPYQSQQEQYDVLHKIPTIHSDKEHDSFAYDNRSQDLHQFMPSTDEAYLKSPHVSDYTHYTHFSIQNSMSEDRTLGRRTLPNSQSNNSKSVCIHTIFLYPISWSFGPLINVMDLM